MNKYLIGGLVVAGGLLLWSWDSAVVSRALASEAGHRADSIAAVNKIKDDRAKADSLALDALMLESATKSARIDSLRAGYVQKAVQASASVRVYSDSLHALLAGQSEPERALEALELGYRTELAAKDSIIAQADSATAVERGLRMATERALASERIVRQGVANENAALRQQVAQLNRTARRDRIIQVIEGAGIAYLLTR